MNIKHITISTMQHFNIHMCDALFYSQWMLSVSFAIFFNKQYSFLIFLVKCGAFLWRKCQWSVFFTMYFERRYTNNSFAFYIWRLAIRLSDLLVLSLNGFLLRLDLICFR